MTTTTARTTARKRPRLPYGLLVPSLLALAVALGYPLVRQVVLSFQEFGLAQQFGRPAEWIGLDNYQRLVTDPYLWKVVLRSIVFCFANAAITMVIGIAIALLMGKLSKPVKHPRPDRPAAGLGDAGAGGADDLAVAVRLRVRRRQLAAGPARFRVRRPLVAARPALVLPGSHGGRGLDERAVRRLHPVRRPHPGAGGGRRGGRGRRRQRVAAVPARRRTHDQAGAAGRRPAPGDLGPAGLHPDLRAAEGRRGHRGHQPARHLHLPARDRGGQLRPGSLRSRSSCSRSRSS